MKLSRQIDNAIDKIVPDEKTKLRRQIEDYLRKYCNLETMKEIAKILNIKH